MRRDRARDDRPLDVGHRPRGRASAGRHRRRDQLTRLRHGTGVAFVVGDGGPHPGRGRDLRCSRVLVPGSMDGVGQRWPAPDATPSLGYPLAAAALLALAGLAIAAASRALRSDAKRLMGAALVMALGALCAAFGIDLYAMLATGLEPRQSSYGAVVFAIVATQGFYVVIVAAMVLYTLARAEPGVSTACAAPHSTIRCCSRTTRLRRVPSDWPSCTAFRDWWLEAVATQPRSVDRLADALGCAHLGRALRGDLRLHHAGSARATLLLMRSGWGIGVVAWVVGGARGWRCRAGIGVIVTSSSGTRRNRVRRHGSRPASRRWPRSRSSGRRCPRCMVTACE